MTERHDYTAALEAAKKVLIAAARMSGVAEPELAPLIHRGMTPQRYPGIGVRLRPSPEGVPQAIRWWWPDEYEFGFYDRDRNWQERSVKPTDLL